MGDSPITGRDPLTGCTLSLRMEGDTIARIETSHEESDLYLSPGFVDLQVNGHSGFDVNANQLTPDMIIGLVKVMLALGVTCFAPTLITAPEDRICHGLSVIAEARRSHPWAAECIPFVHVEGPYISPLPGYRGAHAEEFVRPPSLAEFERWDDTAPGLVGLVTLSPHYDESPAYIASLCKRGVHVAIGHTHASPEQIRIGVKSGARLSTHLGNGIPQVVARHRNPIWPQLAEDRLSATMIADGHHLPEDVLKVLVRAKGVQRSLLVSDSVALAGMPAGLYKTPVGGQVELQPNGKLSIFGSEFLAGSTTSLAESIGHLVHATGIELYQALMMATENPGRFAGGRGRLEVGGRADLVRFRWSDRVLIQDVWLAGQQVYVAGASAGEKQQ